MRLRNYYCAVLYRYRICIINVVFWLTQSKFSALLNCADVQNGKLHADRQKHTPVTWVRRMIAHQLAYACMHPRSRLLHTLDDYNSGPILSAPRLRKYCTTGWSPPLPYTCSAMCNAVAPYPPCVRTLTSAPYVSTSN